MKQKIKTSIADLIMAFDMNVNEYSQYLNLETGGIAIISALGDSFDENGNPIDDVDEFLAQMDESKYVAISGSEPHEAFETMERFIQTVNNQEIQQKLCQALSIKRPFFHFKDVLLNYPEEQKRWFSFQEQATIHRIQNSLKENDLELEGNDKTL